LEIGGKTVTIAGIAKGSGMIAPDMATMLAYVFTDARSTQDGLQAMLTAATKSELQRHHRRQRHLDLRHVLLAATGRSHAVPIASGAAPRESSFRSADTRDADLALQIVRDGEGATKLVEVASPARKRRAMPTRSRGRSPTRRW
jgi:glutamate N-acetyltransferase/amino-acid N-acetyltransferase